jgi:hypothetical protein
VASLNPESKRPLLLGGLEYSIFGFVPVRFDTDAAWG